MRNDTLRVLTRIFAMALIAYSVLMLSRIGLALEHGRADYIAQVEALRPVRTAPFADLSLRNTLEPDASEETADEPAGLVIEEADAPLAALQQINPDIAGWLILDGTKIDFPVLQDRIAREDYLAHGFVTQIEGVDAQELLYRYLFYDYLGSRSELGSVTADYRTALTDPYVLLYGHNAGQRGVMFSDLTRFLDPDYCAGHQTGALYTESGTAELELLAVACVSGYAQEVFGGVNDLSAALGYLVSNASYLSPDARQISLEPVGGRLIVLSTCAIAQHPEDPARLVVVYRTEG